MAEDFYIELVESCPQPQKNSRNILLRQTEGTDTKRCWAQTEYGSDKLKDKLAKARWKGR